MIQAPPPPPVEKSGNGSVYRIEIYDLRMALLEYLFLIDFVVTHINFVRMPYQGLGLLIDFVSEAIDL